MTLFRRLYGHGPLHLLAHVAAFAIAVYALAQIVHAGAVVNFIAWFGGAIVLHDFVFFPLYSGLDRLARALTGARRAQRSVRLVNYVRVPAVISGLLLLIYLPLILRLGDHSYFAASGHHVAGYARNWALITAALFGGSALLYAIRLGTRSRSRR